MKIQYSIRESHLTNHGQPLLKTPYLVVIDFKHVHEFKATLSFKLIQ